VKLRRRVGIVWVKASWSLGHRPGDAQLRHRCQCGDVLGATPKPCPGGDDPVPLPHRRVQPDRPGIPTNRPVLGAPAAVQGQSQWRPQGTNVATCHTPDDGSNLNEIPSTGGVGMSAGDPKQKIICLARRNLGGGHATCDLDLNVDREIHLPVSTDALPRPRVLREDSAVRRGLYAPLIPGLRTQVLSLEVAGSEPGLGFVEPHTDQIGHPDGRAGFGIRIARRDTPRENERDARERRECSQSPPHIHDPPPLGRDVSRSPCRPRPPAAPRGRTFRCPRRRRPADSRP
jgi:hypothetical protein